MKTTNNLHSNIGSNLISNNENVTERWIVSDEEENGIYIKIENSDAIARLYGDNKAVKNREKALINAKLIAAAPELLIAAIEFYKVIQAEGCIPDMDQNRLNELFNDAINKATE